jgi:predicted nuclease of predicted toxin-antitoxin system
LHTLADTNIVAQAVRSLRNAGHNVVYAAEFALDSADENLLAQAVSDHRIFLTKDHDIGALVYRDLRANCGVLLVDDLGAAAAEPALILAVLSAHDTKLIAGVFLRAGAGWIREAND